MAIYDPGYIGTTANRVTLNDFDASPLFRVRSEQPQSRDVRELDIPIPFENGISDFRTLLGEVAYIIEGTMYPGDEAEFDSGLRQLTKVASLEVAQDDNLSDNGYVPYAWTESNGNQKQLFVKVLWVDRKKTTRQGLVLPFKFVCKVKDPTIYGVTLKSATTEGIDPTTTSGAALYDFSYPIVYGASTYSVSSTATNDGSIPVFPVSITVNGPVNVPKITNETTGEYIEINTNLNTDSDVLIISYDKDTLIAEKNGVSVLSAVTAGNTWFKLQPGGNEISLSGSSIGSGAYVEVTFRDAYPLS